MTRKIAFGLLWIGFITYAFWLAPPDQPHTLDLIIKLSTGEWQGINPLIVALFNLMGIWPMIYACVLFFDGHQQKIPAWPFVLGSFAVGAFAILPYLALREANPQFRGKKNLLLKVLDSRWTGLLLTLATLGLCSWGIFAGDWQDFVKEWHSSRFINVMSLDFCLLSILFPSLLWDDLTRRGIDMSRDFWRLLSIPLAGALGYLIFRTPTLTKES